MQMSVRSDAAPYIEAEMLSADQLDEIIDNTSDAMFLNQLLIARACWNRQKLLRTCERVRVALEQSYADAVRRGAIGT